MEDDIRTIWRQHERWLSGCEVSLDHFLAHLLWIGWADIEGIFRRSAIEVAENEALMLLDTAELLAAEGYREIETPAGALEASLQAVPRLGELFDVLHRSDSFDSLTVARVLEAREELIRMGAQVQAALNL